MTFMDDTVQLTLDALDAAAAIRWKKFGRSLTGGNDAAEDFQKALTNLRWMTRDAARETAIRQSTFSSNGRCVWMPSSAATESSWKLWII